ncbi:hypothetical protein HK102_009265 [Quaeritorhiza haematococci]|nr:hypothetical protein HK102_009265 [Quaeritorhiza haematococci]
MAHWVLPELLGIIAGYCARSDLVNLGLVCKDWHSVVVPRLWRCVRLKPSTGIGFVKYRHWIVAIESPFEPLWLLPLLSLLPNLRELFLRDVKNLDALAALFDLNISVLKINRSNDSYVEWNFCWGPSVDRVRARSFLHRLVSIDFGCRWPCNKTKMTIIEDIMHKGLRKINFGMLFDFEYWPIDHLSAAPLTVIRVIWPKNPASFFRIIADHCPHLRALGCLGLESCGSDSANPPVESFRYFMKQRGLQLVALQYTMDGYSKMARAELFEVIIQGCRSLEWFDAEDMWHRFHPDIFTRFLERCGHRLKYLAMGVAGCAENWVEDFFGTQLPILCPNMRRGWFRVGISGDDDKRRRRVLYKGEGRWEGEEEWEWGEEEIMTYGYFDHTRYLE